MKKMDTTVVKALTMAKTMTIGHDKDDANDIDKIKKIKKYLNDVYYKRKHVPKLYSLSLYPRVQPLFFPLLNQHFQSNSEKEAFSLFNFVGSKTS